jgi:integrase/recombinase XerD
VPSIDLSGAVDDAHLVALWLAARPESTVLVYRPVAEAFLKSLEGGLKVTTVAEVVRWFEGLTGEPATKARKVSTIKSLLSFAHRTGYTVYNVGRALRCLRAPSKLHERIVEEPGIQAMFHVTPPGRDHAFLRLMYCSGARISELCKLRWIDLAQPGRISFLGKGAKTRTIIVPQPILDEVLSLRQGASSMAPVFTSMRTPGAALDVRDARNIVYRARDRAHENTRLSPHWLRHAHATHALDHGAPIHLVQQSLGHSNVSTTSAYLHVRPNKGSSTYLVL